MSQMLKRLQIVAFNMTKLDGRLILAYRCFSSIKFEPAGGGNLLPSADPNEYGMILSVGLLSIKRLGDLCRFPSHPIFPFMYMISHFFLAKFHTMLQGNFARKK